MTALALIVAALVAVVLIFAACYGLGLVLVDRVAGPALRDLIAWAKGIPPDRPRR